MYNGQQSRLRMNSLRLVGVLAIAGGAFAVPVVATAATPLPTVTNFQSSVNVLPPEGGKLTLSAMVANATTCTFKVTPALEGLPVTVPCASSAGGAVSVRARGIITVKPGGGTSGNASGKAIHFVFSFSATSAVGTTNASAHPTLTKHGYGWSPTTKLLTLTGSATSISCAGVNFCVVVSSKGTLDVVTTKSRNTNLTDIYVFRSVSCATTSMCVAVDSAGTFVMWNGAKWSLPKPITSVLPPPDLTSVSCPTASFCMAGDAGGNLYSFVPSVGATSSKRFDKILVFEPYFQSCSSASHCLAVDQKGDAAGWNGTTWSPLGNFDTAGSVTALSCAPGGNCTFVDSHGGVVAVSVGYTYAKHAAILDQARTVGCPTPRFCLATNATGSAAQEVNGVWSPPFIIGDDPPDALSCSRGTTSATGVTCAAVNVPGQLKWATIQLK